MLAGYEHFITRRVNADIFVDPRWSHCGSPTCAVVPLRSRSPSSSVHFLGLPLLLKVGAFAEAVSEAIGVPCLPHQLRLICKDDLNPTLNTRTSHSLEWRLEDDDPQCAVRSKVLSTDIVYRGTAYRAVRPLSEGDQVYRILVSHLFVSGTADVYELLVQGLRTFFRQYGTVARIQIMQDHRLDGRGFFSHNEGVVYLLHSAALPELPIKKQSAALPEWNNESFSWQAYPV
ncbi:hypothetical protein DFQ26_007379 [Actinomortierella ambigua]|nr:hypothetical protein DFQ26_007379 [Actinomortierella ambigua]